MRNAVLHRILSRRARADGGFAMLTVILLIMVCAGVSVLMLGVIVAQVKPTVFAAKNTRTISAAEAGVDATLSQLRSATIVDAVTHEVSGDPRLLPCSVRGVVGVASPALRYDVSISYFVASPANKSAELRAASALVCTPGSGLTRAPNFALITSAGSGTAVAGYAASVGDRTIETVYEFQANTSAIDGGVIYTYGAAYCLQAETRLAGARISYVQAANCRVDDATRMWSYGEDYGIHLSVTDLAGTAMCITGRGGVDLTLQPCTTQSDQNFSWEGGARWRGQTVDNLNYSNECLGTGNSSFTDLTGKYLKITTSCASNAAWGAFDPDPRVGAGAADHSKNQVVSFLEFGRCFDVTHENVTEPTMIIYPCKQDPSPGSPRLFWNHKWFYTEPASMLGSVAGQQITVVNGGSSGDPGATYCLTTPASGPYPKLAPCSSAPDQLWTRTAEADTYANSWTFKDSAGRCIGLGEKLVVNGVGTPWTQMIVDACSGGPEQKWNAPDTAQSASLENYKELN